MRKICLIIITILFARAASALTISGKVYNAETGNSLKGIVVGIEELSLITETNNDGVFIFEDIEKGYYTLFFSHKDYGIDREKIRVKQDFYIDKELKKKIYNAGNRDILYREKENNSIKQKITRNDIKNYPMRGFGDALHLLQALPGVGGGFSLATVPVIRGTNPLYNKYYIDDIPVDYPFHYLVALVPFFSSISEESIEEAQVVKGSPQVWSGDNLGNTVNITTRTVEQDGVHGRIILDPIVPLIPLFSVTAVPYKDLSVAVNIRRSDIDWIIDTEKTDLFFQDYFYKVVYNLFDNHRITLLGQGSKDELDYENYETGSGYSVTGLKWEYLINRNLFLKTVLSEYKMEQYLQNKRIYSGAVGAYVKFNPVQDRLFQILNFSYNDFYFKTGYEYIKHKNGCEGNITLNDTIGIDFLDQTSVSETLYWPVNGVSHSMFVQSGIRNSKGWFDIGIRDEKYGPTGEKSASYAVDCGINIRKNISAYMKHSTNYAHPDVYYYLGAADTDFKDAKAVNWAVGSDVNLYQNFNISWELYYAKYDNLNQDILYNISDEFYKKIVQMYIYTDEDSGKTYGAELYFKWRRSIFSGWISYAYSVSGRDNEEESDFYSDFDQTHIFRLVFSAVWKRWTYSAIWHQYSSMPYSPVTGTTSVGDYYAADYGEKNSERYGMHSRIDLKASYQFNNVRIYFEFWNVLIRQENGVFEYFDNDKEYSGSNPERINDLPLFLWLGMELSL